MHYVRIWHISERPSLSNWDPVLGFAWWQDPGFTPLAIIFALGSAHRLLFSGFQWR